MSPSKSFKAYVRRLSNSGLPGCATTLARLASMGQTEAFQWYMDNKYAPAVDKLAANQKDDVQGFVNDVLNVEDTDESDAIAPAIVEAAVSAPVAKKTRTSRRKVDVQASDEPKDATFKAGMFTRYGIDPTVGATFLSKSGNAFVVTAVESDHIRAARA